MNWVLRSLAIACLCMFLVVQTNGRCSEYEKMFGCKDSRNIPVKKCTEFEKLYGCQDSKPDKLKRHLRVSEGIPEAHRSAVQLPDQPDERWNLKMERGFKHRKRALLNYK
ncbi:hypothetical protein ABFA07_004402 [Porites harrisoni]